MKLYVANTTKQIQELQYRVPENPKIMVDVIKPGEQRRVYKEDATSYEIDAIISQLERFGAVKVDAVDRSKEFNGVCYSIDKPVKADAMLRVLAHNDDVLEQRGFELRQAAAVAMATEGGILDRGRGLNEVEVTITEESKPDDPEGAPKIQQTTHVTREATAPKRSRKRA